METPLLILASINDILPYRYAQYVTRSSLQSPSVFPPYQPTKTVTGGSFLLSSVIFVVVVLYISTLAVPHCPRLRLRHFTHWVLLSDLFALDFCRISAGSDGLLAYCCTEECFLKEDYRKSHDQSGKPSDNDDQSSKSNNDDDQSSKSNNDDDQSGKPDNDAEDLLARYRKRFSLCPSSQPRTDFYR